MKEFIIPLIASAWAQTIQATPLSVTISPTVQAAYFQ
jgi:hypothetical protein